MARRLTIVIQAADVWGDDEDSLGHDRRLLEKAVRYRPPDKLVIVLPNVVRCARASELTAVSPSLLIEETGNTNIDFASATEVVVACRGAWAARIKSLDELITRAGFRRAGRAWGAAGDTRRYVWPASARIRLQAAAQEARVHVGAAVVRMRDGWAHPVRRALGKGRATLGWGISKRDVLDDGWGSPHEDQVRLDVRDILPARAGIDLSPWTIDFDAAHTPRDRAGACFEEHGVWPISFSYPRDPLPIEPNPALLVAPIVPGLPYSFVDERDYLMTYRSAFLGITHRKAGWDCFRHLEILASGAVPFMLDSQDMPGYVMIHYPTEALRAVRKVLSTTGGPPSMTVREGFRDWLRNHLTSRALAHYVLDSTGLDESARVLFVDERLPSMPDYQSVLTLIGLQQLLGKRCNVAFPVDYIYQDTRTDTAQLYGRGFGYTRVLSPELRPAPTSAVDGYDAIIIGSITRNMALATQLLGEAPTHTHIWIHGEDTPPTPREVADLRASGVHLFIRAIHSGPQGRG